MLLYVTRSDNMSFKSHFGKRLLRKWSGNEYFFYLFYFNTIAWNFPKMHKLPFWTSNAIFSKWRNFRLHIFLSLSTHISGVKHATELCVIPF